MTSGVIKLNRLARFNRNSSSLLFFSNRSARCRFFSSISSSESELFFFKICFSAFTGNPKRAALSFYVDILTDWK